MEQSYHTLQNIARSTSGITLRNGLKLKEKGVLPVLQPRDFTKGEQPEQPLYLDHYPKSIENHFLIRGDVLLANKGTKFASFLFTGDYPCIASAAFFVIRVQKEKCYPQFLRWYLEQPEAKDYLLSNSITSTVPSLSKAVLDNLSVPIVPMAIQKTIIDQLQVLQEQENILNEMLLKAQDFKNAYIWEQIEKSIYKNP